MSKNEDLSYTEYQNQFRGDKREKALERAWKNRDFEIELYWKRATYFWAFLVSAFAGYFLLLSRKDALSQFPASAFIVSCIGFTFAYAWYRVNQGSKKWQVNWEKHIDMLENSHTGPIYKTILKQSGWSVSGVNLEVSLFITHIWAIVSGYSLYQFIAMAVNQPLSGDLIIANSIAIVTGLFYTICFIFRIKTHKRGIDNENDAISFELRSNEYENT